MKVFTWIGASGCGLLFFFDKNTIELGMIAFGLATFGYAGSIVYYNSFLPVIAKPEDHDRISARGYSMGYLGRNHFIAFQPDDDPEARLVRHSGSIQPCLPASRSCLFASGGLVFRRSLLRVFQSILSRKERAGKASLSNGYRELQNVYRQIRKSRTLSIYLVSYFFFMMGLLSVMLMAASFGKKQVGLG